MRLGDVLGPAYRAARLRFDAEHQRGERIRYAFAAAGIDVTPETCRDIGRLIGEGPMLDAFVKACRDERPVAAMAAAADRMDEVMG